MLEPSGHQGPSPRYSAIILGLATLLSLLTNVLVKSWLSAGLVLTLVMVAGFAIYRVRLFWYDDPPEGIAQDRPFRWSAGAMVVLIILLARTLASLPSQRPSVEVVQQPDPNAAVINCMRNHKLERAYEKSRQQEVKDEDLGGQPPTPSQQEYLRSLPGAELYRTVFSWCNWPRPPWAQDDGYTMITATELRGPDKYAIALDSADRIKLRTMR
jgi:hypothetical protein